MSKTKFGRIVAAILAVLSLLFFLFFASQVFNDLTLAKEKTIAVISDVDKSTTRRHSKHSSGYHYTDSYSVSYMFTDIKGEEHYVSPRWSTSFSPGDEGDEVTLHYNRELPEKVWYTTFTLKLNVYAMCAALLSAGVCAILAKYGEAVEDGQ